MIEPLRAAADVVPALVAFLALDASHGFGLDAQTRQRDRPVARDAVAVRAGRGTLGGEGQFLDPIGIRDGYVEVKRHAGFAGFAQHNLS
jgi:hypothetical protein